MDVLNRSNASLLTKTEKTSWELTNAVLSSTFVWILIYNISTLILPWKRPVWHCRLVCLIYGVVICTMIGFVTQVFENPWPLENAGR